MSSAGDTPPLPLIKRTDQVFQLSLTELAFIVIFVLLILLGWLVQHEKQRGTQMAKELTDARETAATAGAWEDIRDDVAAAAKAGPPGSKERNQAIDEKLSDLVKRNPNLAERQRLQQALEQRELELTALTAIKAVLTSAAGKVEGEPGKGPATEQAVTEAVAFKARLEKEMGRPVKPAEAARLAEQLAIATQIAKDTKGAGINVKEILAANENLKGQVQYYKAKIDKNGLDHPPCWADPKTGEIQYLFTIDMHPTRLVLTRRWPDTRDADAHKLPNLDALLVTDGLALETFSSLTQGIDQVSKAGKCRHFVWLQNHIPDLATFNKMRYGIENFFYKYEARNAPKAT